MMDAMRVLFASAVLFSIACLDARADCATVMARTCALPFPSNEFARADTTSPTGIRLAIQDDVLPAERLALLPASVRPAVVLNGRDGFSPLAAAMFELATEAPLDRLVAQPRQWVHAYSVDTGAAIDVVVSRSPLNDSTGFSWGPIVEVYPATRFPFGERIVIAIASPDGASVPAAYRSQTRELSGDAWQLLQRHGVVPASVIAATEYTIASRDSIVGEHQRAQAAIAAYEPPVRWGKTTYFNKGDVAALVRGEVRLADFRGGDGLVDADNDAIGNAQWVPFDLYLPRSATKTPAPVMIYGHGVTAFRQTAFFMYPQNAKHGFATLAIDQPNHGSRGRIDGYNIFNLLRPDRMQRGLGMVMQSAFDMHGLLTAIEKRMASLDKLPRRSLLASGDGRPDLDVTRVIYGGTSMGGVLGSGFVAFDDRIDGAYLQVAGTSITHIMTHSSFWELLGFKNLISPEFSAGETAFTVALAQHVVDMVEGAMNAESFNRDTKPLFMQYGLDDAVAINESTYALARLAGLALNPPLLREVPAFAVNAQADPLMAIAQVEPASPRGWMRGFTAHLTFFKPEANAMFEHWLQAMRAALY